MRLKPEDEILLRDVVGLSGGWYVDDDNIPSCGRLIDAGYVRAVSDYDVIKLYPTDAGCAAAMRRGLVRRSTADELAQPYSHAFVRVALKPPAHVSALIGE